LAWRCFRVPNREMQQLSKQERFQVTSKPVVPNSRVAQTFRQQCSRLLNRQKRRHKNQTCCDEHVVQIVDGHRLIADDDRQRRRHDRDAIISEVHWCLTPETRLDGHSKLVLHSLRHTQPVQIFVK